MRFLFLMAVFIGSNLGAQPLRDINFNYLYSPNEPFSVDIQPVRLASGWNVQYRLNLQDTLNQISDFEIQWEIRDGLQSKQGKPIAADSVVKNEDSSERLSGTILVKQDLTVQLLVAKVTNIVLKRAWLFYTALEPKFPVNGYLTRNSLPVVERYIKVGTPLSVSGSSPAFVAYYDDVFPPAPPAFEKAVGRVSPALRVDSSFVANPENPISFAKTGLYLFQYDTLAAEGFTIRVEDDYPRLAKVESLADPLTYICTSQEMARIRQAKGDKRAFDKVILSMTKDTERAKLFMKNYFRRVELANQYFTSYKEGWKTDRGMVYIIFGVPDQVFKTMEREIWYYKNSAYKITLEFAKSPTLFDPENYVLLREKKFEYTLYQVIDLLRNARF
ncbi:MAG TPA: GWxTD domain-containing protein [Ohtaekwangia sp.]|nr:GWxTD domain-containing protein [Ohtaekwangia sp.]